MLISTSLLAPPRSGGRITAQFTPRSWPRRLGAVLLSAAFILGSVAAHAVTHASAKKSSAKTHKTIGHHYYSAISGITPSFHWRMKSSNFVFPGSHELLVQQNQEMDRAQMFRVMNDVDLMQHELAQELVPVNETDALKLAGDLPDNRRYCRPWTRDFLQEFSEAFYSEFHAPLQVNSLVRTVEQQARLRRHNHFAAPEWGDTASTHLTGATFDLSRRGLTPMQYAWITSYLLPLKEAGMVDPIEERQPVLHIVVFEKYGDRSGGGASSWSEAAEPTEMSQMGTLGTAGGSQP
jgi:hypothetical protein